MLTLGLALTLFATQVQASTHAASLDVVISEIAWMGTTASSYDEWIELYNNTAGPIDLTDRTLNAVDLPPSISLKRPVLPMVTSFWNAPTVAPSLVFLSI